MYAKITKDLLYDLEYGVPSREGMIVVNDNRAEVGEVGVEVRLLDDDRIPYYEALATDDALEDLWSWAARDISVMSKKEDKAENE